MTPMNKQIKYVKLIPLLIINLFPVYGVLRLGWLIGDIFFWFYFDLLMTFIFVYWSLKLFWKYNIGRNPQLNRLERKMFIWNFIIIFTFATIFCLLPIKAQWSLYGNFGNFFAQKSLTMLLIIITGFIDWRLKHADKSIYQKVTFDQITMPLAQKSFPLIFLYGILMLHYHISGAKELSLNNVYVMGMFLILTFGKVMADIFILYKYEL